MKRLILLLSAIALSMAGCGENGKLDMKDGTGRIEYDGSVYDVDISTVITSGPDIDDLYSHHVSFVSSETGNFFAFQVTNDSSASDIPTGEYIVTGEDNQASFSVKPDGVNSITGHPTGTMTVTKSGESHNFHFEGIDTVAADSPKSVRFRFSGKLVRIS